MKVHVFRWFGAAALLTTAVTSFGQTLTVTDGLALWLRADAGVTTNDAGRVMQWDDQSGNLNHAFQATELQMPLFVPNAITNKPALRFDGSANAGEHDYLNIPHAETLAFTGDMTTLFVIKVDDWANYNAVWSKTSANFPAPTDLYTDVNTGFMRVYRGDGTLAGSSSVASTQPVRLGEYLVLAVDIQGAAATHYLNGQTNGTGTVPPAVDTGQDMKIGSRNDLFTKMRGDIAEILIYNRSLSQAERTNAFYYLQTKYNLLNSIPSVTVSANPAGPNVSVGTLATITATAVDLDGSIARVEFFANGMNVGTATAPPYSVRARIDSAGPVVFTARAVDNRDGAGTSAPLMITAGPGGPVVDPVTEGLQLWLKADAGTTLGTGDAVLEWADQSGNLNTAVQSDETMAPVLVQSAVNGRPALRFDGANDVMDVADADSISITGDISTFYVARFTDFQNFRAIWGKTAGPGGNLPAPNDLYVLRPPDQPLPRFFRGNGVSGQQQVTGTRAFPANFFVVAAVEAAGSNVTHYLGTTPTGSGIITAVTGDGNTPLKIGSRQDGATRMKGDIAELLIYDRALSASDRQAVLRYLGEKYAVAEVIATNSLPLVSIASPATPVLQAPASITVTADASDADGAVVSVQFFVNGIRYATDTNAPYSITVDLPYGGNLTLRTVATDNLGATRTSPTTTYCVQGPSAPAGLVAYWPLNGNGDASVGPDGVLVNGASAAADRQATASGAIAVNGAQLQRVEVPGGGGLSGAQQGTISMWVNWNGTQDGGAAGSFGAVLGRQQDGAFSANVISLNAADPAIATVQWRRGPSGGAATITGVTPVGNDAWHHVAVTFTTTNCELYVDGNLEGTGGASSLAANATTPLTIGAWIGGGGSYATATIDDVAIWNRVLSASEISDLALGASPLALAPQPDCLRIQPALVTGREIRWGSDAILQHAESIDGPWQDVTGAVSPYTVPQGTIKFYRLRSNL